MIPGPTAAATAVAVAVAACALALSACSSDSTSTFNGGDASVAPGPNGDAATFNDDGGDAGLDAPTTCAPAALDGGAPAYKPPTTAKGACTGPLLQGYAGACLAQPLDPAKCDAFKQTNGTCAACIESDDTAASLGPVIWHLGRQYFTLNVPGCIALEQKDTTSTGCAAAYQAAQTCNEKACESCFFIQQPTFAKFTACEQSALGGVCASYGATESSACAGIKDPDAATSVCFGGVGATTTQLFLAIAPTFCL